MSHATQLGDMSLSSVETGLPSLTTLSQQQQNDVLKQPTIPTSSLEPTVHSTSSLLSSDCLVPSSVQLPPPPPPQSSTELADNTIPKNGKSSSVSIPAPLNLPKRFIINQNNNQGSETVEESLSNSNSNSNSNTNTNTNTNANIPKDMQNYQYIPYPRQPTYQQTYLNTQTGTLMALPISAPPYPYSNIPPQLQQFQQPVILVQQRLSQSIPPPLPQQQQQQQQQVYYTRTANGTFVPVILPSSQQVIPKSIPVSTTSEQTTSNKRQKVSPPNNKNSSSSSSPSSIQNAEQIQRQLIQRQLQMYPNLQDLQTPNVSDIYQSTNSTSRNQTSGNNEFRIVSQLPSNDDTLANTNEHDQDSLDPQSESHSSDHSPTSTLQNQTHGDTIDNTQTESKKSKAQRIIGTVTLGSFTYKYSQTLSGDSTKDKELFDRLTDNAWKSCLTKR